MTEQPKREKTIGEQLDEMLIKKGLPPIPMVNQSPKRAWITIHPRTPKSDTKNQDTLDESIDKEEL